VLEPRERRTITIAVAVLATALLILYGALPYARRWSAREDLIAIRAEQVARLRWLAANESSLRKASSERLARATRLERPRLLAGRSAALAASALQTVVQGYADEAGITVRELNVAGAPDSASAGFESIPATVSAVGDSFCNCRSYCALRTAAPEEQSDDSRHATPRTRAQCRDSPPRSRGNPVVGDSIACARWPPADRRVARCGGDG
jgi:hypothetical protein